jgi:hypothetical protein
VRHAGSGRAEVEGSDGPGFIVRREKRTLADTLIVESVNGPNKGLRRTGSSNGIEHSMSNPPSKYLSGDLAASWLPLRSPLSINQIA